MTRNVLLAAMENGAGLAAKLVGLLFFAWLLGPEGQGQFTLFIVSYSLATNVGMFGLDTANTYWRARLKHHRSHSALVGNSLVLGPIFGLLAVAATGFLFDVLGFVDQLPPKTLPLLCGAIMSGVVVLPLGALLFGADMFFERLVGSILHSVIFVAGLAFLFLWGDFSLFGAMAFWTIGLLCCGLYWLMQLIDAHQTGTDFGGLGFSSTLARRQIKYGLRAYPYFAMSAANFRLDNFLVTGLLGVSALGIYSVAVAVTEIFLYLPRAFVNVVLLDVASGKRERIVDVTTVLSAACLVVSPILALVLPTALWLLLPGEFMKATWLVLLLMPGTFAMAIATVGAYYLFGKAQEVSASWAATLGAVSTVGFNLLLIPSIGIAGAAIASSFAYGVFCWAILRVASKRLGISIASLLKPDFQALCRGGRALAGQIKLTDGLNQFRK